MAQTKNGERIYDYYTLNPNAIEFASDWMDFFNDTRLGNKFDKWDRYCDEFAEWVLTLIPYRFEVGAYGLIKDEDEEEDE
jgi:hypothetical protein